MSSPRPSRALDQARALIPDLEESGLPISVFCRERGVSSWAMYKAAREARGSAAPPAAEAPTLTEVAVVPTTSPTTRRPAQLEIALPSGISIRVPVDFDEVALRRLLGVLAAC